MVRLHDPLLSELDTWINSEDPDLSRPEAIRRIVTDWLKKNGHLNNK